MPPEMSMEMVKQTLLLEHCSQIQGQSQIQDQFTSTQEQMVVYCIKYQVKLLVIGSADQLQQEMSMKMALQTLSLEHLTQIQGETQRQDLSMSMFQNNYI